MMLAHRCLMQKEDEHYEETFRFMLIDGSPFGHRHRQNWEFKYATTSELLRLSSAQDKLIEIRAAHKGMDFDAWPSEVQARIPSLPLKHAANTVNLLQTELPWRAQKY